MKYLFKLKVCIAALTLALSAQASFGAELKIGGTGVALGGMKLLAEGFEDLHPEMRVVVLPSLGSGGGIKALAAGAIDISVSARPVKEKEATTGVSAKPYAATALVVAANHSVPSDALTPQELAALYSGGTTTWANGTPVRVVLRPKSETDVKLLRQLTPEMGSAMDAARLRDGLMIALNDQENADAIEGTDGAVGLVAMNQIASENRNLKVLLLRDEKTGLRSTNDGIIAEKTLFVVLPEQPSSRAQDFVDFVFSAEGQSILRNSNHLPVN